MHAVKASYNHLTTQRTQLYGNLWYREKKSDNSVDWERLDFQSESKRKGSTSGSSVPKPLIGAMKKVRNAFSGNRDVGDRNL